MQILHEASLNQVNKAAYTDILLRRLHQDEYMLLFDLSRSGLCDQEISQCRLQDPQHPTITSEAVPVLTSIDGDIHDFPDRIQISHLSNSQPISNDIRGCLSEIVPTVVEQWQSFGFCELRRSDASTRAITGIHPPQSLSFPNDADEFLLDAPSRGGFDPLPSSTQTSEQ